MVILRSLPDSDGVQIIQQFYSGYNAIAFGRKQLTDREKKYYRKEKAKLHRKIREKYQDFWKDGEDRYNIYQSRTETREYYSNDDITEKRKIKKIWLERELSEGAVTERQLRKKIREKLNEWDQTWKDPETAVSEEMKLQKL